MNEPRVFEFEEITVSGKSFSEMTVRAPQIGELEKALKGETELSQGIILLSLVTGLGRVVIEKLPAPVFMEASQYLSGFIPSFRETGES